MGIHLTATFEYTAFRDIQTSGADISNELSLGLNAEIPITVYIPRNRSTHDQAVRLNVSLHIAAFTDNHIAGNGYVAVNMPVNADIAGAFHISFNSRFPSNDCRNVTYGIVDMFFHAAKHESFPFPVSIILPQSQESCDGFVVPMHYCRFLPFFLPCLHSSEQPKLLPLLERRNPELGGFGRALDHEAVLDGKASLLPELPHDVFFGKPLQKSGLIVGI